MVNNAFANIFKEARLAASGGSVLEQDKDFGNVSTNMTVLTSKDGELFLHIDKINKTEAEINITPLKHIFFDHHEEANRGKIKG